MTPAPKRRWLRFRMRTLLAFLTLTCVVLGVRFGLKPNWINGRQKALSDIELDWADVPEPLRKMQWWGKPHVPSRSGYGTRFTLWFYGVPHQSQVRVPILVGGRAIVMVGGRTTVIPGLTDDPKIQAITRLFPEADVFAIPLPWHDGIGPRLGGTAPVGGSAP